MLSISRVVFIPVGTLHVDEVKVVRKPIYKDELITVVPVLLTEEGVHNNGLKDWDTLYDPRGLEGFMWFERRPIVDGHPGFPVNHLVPKYGYIRNVKPDPVSRTVPAEAVLFNNMFSENEMREIDNGNWLGISIGYYCNEIKTNDVRVWKDGSKYDHYEVGPLYADHVALVKNPACKRCGLNTNSLYSNCGKCKLKETEIMPEEKKPAPTGKVEAPVAGGAEPPVVNEELKAMGGRAIATLDKKLKANSIPEEIAIKARTILGLADDYAKGKAAIDLLLELATEEGSAAAMTSNSQKDPPKKHEENAIMTGLEPLVNSIKDLTGVVTALKEDSNKTKAELKKLQDKDAARENEIKANEEKRVMEGLKKNFDAAYQMDFEKIHWPKIKENALGITGFLADPENLKHWDPKGNEAVEVNPVGMSFAVQENAMPKGLKMMSIEEMTRKQYPNYKEADMA